MHKIKTILVTGYLGAGKTTLMTSLLSNDFFRDRKNAVLVNEFGSLPIDGALIPKGKHSVIELASGSIFCVCVKTELLKDLEKIAREIKPEFLLIEATGVAEPRDISSLFQTDFLRESYGQFAVITVVDCMNYPKLSGILPALKMQVKAADLIILNKTDLAEKQSVETLECEIREINPGAEVAKTVMARFDLDPEKLFPIHQTSKSEKDFMLCEQAPKNTFSCEFRSDAELDRIKFYRILDEHRNDILRGKGLADFGNGKFFVEVINGVVSSRPGQNIIFNSGYKCLMSFVLRNIQGEKFREKLLEAEK